MTEVIPTELRNDFLDTLNQKGFLLEQKTSKILSTKILSKSLPGLGHLKEHEVFNHFGERVEIDFLLTRGPWRFLIECKRTDYSWFFPKILDKPRMFYIIRDSSNGMEIIINPAKVQTTNYNIALKLDSPNKLKKKKIRFETSYGDIHDNIKQILKEVEAYVCNERFLDNFLIPTLVTNAKLYQVDYSEEHLDDNGNLKDYDELPELDYVIYNFPEMIRWDKGRQLLQDKHTSMSQDHNKSVFIVNVNHLESFINNFESIF